MDFKEIVMKRYATKKFDGKNVTLNGWVYNIRSIGKIWFLILRDGSGLVQCVVIDKETDKKTFELENKLTDMDINYSKLNTKLINVQNNYEKMDILYDKIYSILTEQQRTELERFINEFDN